MRSGIWYTGTGVSAPPDAPDDAPVRRAGVWAAALAVAAGLASAPVLGLVPSVSLAAVAAAVAAWLARRSTRSLTVAGEVVAALATVGLALVLAGIAARAAGGILTAVPAAIWSAAAGLATALLWPRRLRGAVVAVLVAAAAAGVAGDRFEAAGRQARGRAVSGPIYGIHPFQITAVRIDGYGPFDLPLNDYVEPGAHRGYGPEELAEAVALALHRIAEVHFADGPARARKAFGEATAAALRTEGIRERLDREPGETVQPRFVVASGTHGPGSSVEFVCPGHRNDPRGFSPVSPMVKMCPDKYAAEASAGLGVTGRWAGYTEFRGTARTSLAAPFGAARSDDAAGRRVVAAERLGWGLVVGLFVAAAAGRRRPALAGLRGGTAGALVLLALLCGAAASVAPAGIVAVQSPVGPIPPEAVLPGLAALLAVAGAAGFAPPAPRGRTAGSGGARPLLVPALLVVVASAVAGVAPRATDWFAPGLGPDAAAPGAAPVLALAGRLALATGIDVQVVEAVAGGGFVLLLVGAAAAAARAAAERLAPSGSLGLATVAASVGLGGSLLAAFAPRAGGGASLVAVAGAVGLALAVCRLPGGGVATRGLRGLLWLAAAGGIALPLLAGGAARSPVTLLGVVAGAAAVLVLLAAGPRRSDGSGG